MRTVTAEGWPYNFRAYIIEVKWFGKPRWRYVIERKWVHWEHYKTSRRFKSEDEAIEAADRWLDKKEGNLDKEFI